MYNLTNRELEILELIKEGKSSKDIAKSLNISANTVENHRSNIIKKLNIAGKNALLLYVISHASKNNKKD